MRSVLADDLVANVNAIINIGRKKDLTDTDMAQLQLHYFHMGFVVMANITYMTAALELMASFRTALQFREPTIEELKDQIRKMSSPDEQPLGSPLQQNQATKHDD